MERRVPSPVMARKLRVEYPGAVYRVMNRGDRREPIFRDHADRQRFVETLLAQKQVTSHIRERVYRNRLLSDEQKESNRWKSRIRARIEHIFGYMSQSLKGLYLALHWAAAQRGGHRVDQPNLQPGPLRIPIPNRDCHSAPPEKRRLKPETTENPSTTQDQTSGKHQRKEPL